LRDEGGERGADNQIKYNTVLYLSNVSTAWGARQSLERRRTACLCDGSTGCDRSKGARMASMKTCGHVFPCSVNACKQHVFTAHADRGNIVRCVHVCGPRAGAPISLAWQTGYPEMNRWCSRTKNASMCLDAGNCNGVGQQNLEVRCASLLSRQYSDTGYGWGKDRAAGKIHVVGMHHGCPTPTH